jgi:hypothetical protein
VIYILWLIASLFFNLPVPMMKCLTS